MGFKKRLAAALLLAAVAFLTFGIARSGMQVSEKQEEKFPAFTGEKDTLYLWYTDEALTSYLTSAAVTYNENHDVRIVPVLQSGPEYLEQINAASLSGEEMPDLYILSHDSLEKAYLAGLAVGYWENKEDVIKNQQIGRVFEPNMDPEERAAKRKGWNKAVKYAFGWAKDSEEEEE